MLLLLAGLALAQDLLDPHPGSVVHPHDLALIVTIDDYTSLPPIPYADADADAFATWLLHTHRVPAHRIQRVEDPTARTFGQILHRTLQRAHPDGTIWVHVVAHGAVSPGDGLHRILAADTRLDDLESAVALEKVETALADAPGQAVLVLDLGFSGVTREAGELIPGTLFRATPPPPPPDVLTWYGAAPDSSAPAVPGVGHGLFTWSVVGALRGWADGELTGRPDGRVTAEEAQHYVRRAATAFGATTPPPLALHGPLLARTLAEGRLEVGPDLAAVAAQAGPATWPLTPTDPDALAWRALETDLREQVAERAARAWSQARNLYMIGHPDGPTAVRRFLQTYSAISYLVDGREIIVTAPQAREARALMGGRQLASLDRPTMVKVPIGDFYVGSPAGEVGRRSDETLHSVTLTRPFALARTEVTARQWRDVMGVPVGDDTSDLPVHGVRWLDAIEFCNRLSLLDGLEPAYEVAGRHVTWRQDLDGWRLPTEAEWERAARWGGTHWPGFDRPELACSWGNVLDQSAAGPGAPFACRDGYPGPSPVGRYNASEGGLDDLVGNVTEWTWDPASRHGAQREIDPLGDGPAARRIAKGCAWDGTPATCRPAARQLLPFDEPAPGVGLRLARTLPSAAGTR